MLIATTERVAGREVGETLGEVFGISVRSRGLLGNALASLKTIVGGEIAQGITEIVAYGTAVRFKRV